MCIDSLMPLISTQFQTGNKNRSNFETCKPIRQMLELNNDETSRIFAVSSKFLQFKKLGWSEEFLYKLIC